jgi:hypothetical protein
LMEIRAAIIFSLPSLPDGLQQTVPSDSLPKLPALLMVYRTFIHALSYNEYQNIK